MENSKKLYTISSAFCSRIEVPEMEEESLRYWAVITPMEMREKNYEG